MIEQDPSLGSLQIFNIDEDQVSIFEPKAYLLHASYIY